MCLTVLCLLNQHFILSVSSWGQRTALQGTKCSQMALQINILYTENLRLDHNFSSLLNSPDRARNNCLKELQPAALDIHRHTSFHFTSQRQSDSFNQISSLSQVPFVLNCKKIVKWIFCKQTHTIRKITSDIRKCFI